MKWSTYTELTADPQVGASTLWHVNCRGEQDIREWVEQKLTYIAVRPWDTLDFAEGEGSITFYDRASCFVHYSVTNDPQNGHYIRTTYDTPGEESEDPDPATPSIEAIMDVLRSRETEYWARQPGEHTVKIEAIVRVRTIYSETDIQSLSFDVYLPPEGYTI